MGARSSPGSPRVESQTQLVLGYRPCGRVVIRPHGPPVDPAVRAIAPLGRVWPSLRVEVLPLQPRPVIEDIDVPGTASDPAIVSHEHDREMDVRSKECDGV